VAGSQIKKVDSKFFLNLMVKAMRDFGSITESMVKARNCGMVFSLRKVLGSTVKRLGNSRLRIMMD